MGIPIDEVKAIVDPLASAAGMDLEDLAIEKVGRREKISVIVDADGGVDLDAIAELSSAVAAELDAREAIAAEPYVLEVTSPGVDRPLVAPRHWRRAHDRLVAVEMSDGGSILGRVRASDDTSATVEVDGDPVEVRYAECVRAVVQVEFDRKDA